MPERSLAPAFTVGRIVSWVVVALMGVSILYAAWIAASNWRFIMV